MSAEILRRAAEAIRFDVTDHTGPWSLLPDDFGPAVADWLDDEATDAQGYEPERVEGIFPISLAAARAYLGGAL